MRFFIIFLSLFTVSCGSKRVAMEETRSVEWFSDDSLETISAKMVSKDSSFELSIDSIVLTWIDQVPADTLVYPSSRSSQKRAVAYGLKRLEVSKTSASDIESKDFRDLNHWTANDSSAKSIDKKKTKAPILIVAIFVIMFAGAIVYFVRTR